MPAWNLPISLGKSDIIVIKIYHRWQGQLEGFDDAFWHRLWIFKKPQLIGFFFPISASNVSPELGRWGQVFTGNDGFQEGYISLQQGRAKVNLNSLPSEVRTELRQTRPFALPVQNFPVAKVSKWGRERPIVYFSSLHRKERPEGRNK